VIDAHWPCVTRSRASIARPVLARDARTIAVDPSPALPPKIVGVHAAQSWIAVSGRRVSCRIGSMNQRLIALACTLLHRRDAASWWRIGLTDCACPEALSESSPLPGEPHAPMGLVETRSTVVLDESTAYLDKPEFSPRPTRCKPGIQEHNGGEFAIARAFREDLDRSKGAASTSPTE
jgi:hypothetical protein